MNAARGLQLRFRFSTVSSLSSTLSVGPFAHARWPPPPSSRPGTPRPPLSSHLILSSCRPTRRLNKPHQQAAQRPHSRHQRLARTPSRSKSTSPPPLSRSTLKTTGSPATCETVTMWTRTRASSSPCRASRRSPTPRRPRPARPRQDVPRGARQRQGAAVHLDPPARRRQRQRPTRDSDRRRR
ncbi:hypothetical protein DMC30DRAFT_448095, partial [Rhodotorula diobovata]